MKKNKEFEEYLYKVIKKYSKILLMNQHTFKVQHGCNSEKALMECVFNYPYLNVTINYSNELIEKWKNKENIMIYIVHEMCHPITDPLYCKATERWASEGEVLAEREKLTDYICNIVIKNKL